MSSYLPSLRPSQVFNLADFNYQDSYIDFYTGDARYARFQGTNTFYGQCTFQGVTATSVACSSVISENVACNAMTLGGTNILDLISSANTSGGGYFLVWAETSALTTATTNGYWNFGSGVNNNTFRLGIFPPTSTLTYINIVASAIITGTAPIITITKLVGGVGNASTNVIRTINIPIGSNANSRSVVLEFSQGDCVQIQTTQSAGGGGGISRISLTFQTVGITGAKGDKGDTGLTGVGITPILSVGSVISGTTPNVYLTGDTVYPVMNFVLPKGDKGETGETGATGAIGQTGANGSKGDSGITPTFTFDNITTLESSYQCTLTTSVLNNSYNLQFGIPRGAMPTIVGATTTALAENQSPTCTITQVTPGVYSLAFGIPTALPGLKGDKGDRGEKGSQADSTIEAIAAAGIATAAAGTAGGFAASAAQSAFNAAASATAATTNYELRVAALETKTQYQSTGTSVSATPKTSFTLCDLVVSNGVSTTFSASFDDGAVNCGDITSSSISAGTIDCGDITSTGNVKGHLVGDLDFASTIAASNINIGQNSSMLLNTINIGKSNDLIYINGALYSPMASYFANNYVNQFGPL